MYVESTPEWADDVRRTALRVGAGVLKLRGEPVASHETAALLWGLPTLRPPTTALQLTRPRRGRGTDKRYPGIVVHQAGLPANHRAVRLGAPVTNVARTVADLARTRSFRAGLVAGDAALRMGLCTREELVATCTDCTRWPGVRMARAVAGFVDVRAESPLESLSRAAFHEYGLPAPELQVWLTDYDRVDFLWRRQRVIGEADGLAKYTTRDDLLREKTRQELLERMGFRFVRWTWDEIFRRPDAIAHLIHTTLHHP
ncbi:MAG: DUF559 domain-containing protein [Micromonosporaceae bacterium]